MCGSLDIVYEVQTCSLLHFLIVYTDEFAEQIGTLQVVPNLAKKDYSI